MAQSASNTVELLNTFVNVQWNIGLLRVDIDVIGYSANFDVRLKLNNSINNFPGDLRDRTLFPSTESEHLYSVRSSYTDPLPVITDDDNPKQEWLKAYNFWTTNFEKEDIEGTLHKTVTYWFNLSALSSFFSKFLEDNPNEEIAVREIYVTVHIPAGQHLTINTTYYYTWDIDAEIVWNPIPPIPPTEEGFVYIWAGPPSVQDHILASIALIMSNNPGYHLELRSEEIPAELDANLSFTVNAGFYKKIIPDPDFPEDFYYDIPDGYEGVVAENAPYGGLSPATDVKITYAPQNPSKASRVTIQRIP